MKCSAWFSLALIIWSAGNAIMQDLITLRGRVNTEDGRPVKNLIVRVAGYGEAKTTVSGEFIIQLPSHLKAGDPIQFVIKDEKLRIKIPWEGKLNVPADTKGLIEIVVVPVNAVKSPSLMETINKTFVALANRLYKTEEDKQKAIEQEASLKEIATLLPQFISRAKDVRDSFGEVSEYLTLNTGTAKNEALAELSNRVRAYNEAYNELNNNRFYFVQNVKQYWDSAELATELDEIFNFALEKIHKDCILKLNEIKSLINILNAADKMSKKESSSKIKEIENKTHKITADFDGRIRELEEKVKDFFINASLEPTK